MHSNLLMVLMEMRSAIYMRPKKSTTSVSTEVTDIKCSGCSCSTASHLCIGMQVSLPSLKGGKLWLPQTAEVIYNN